MQDEGFHIKSGLLLGTLKSKKLVAEAMVAKLRWMRWRIDGVAVEEVSLGLGADDERLRRWWWGSAAARMYKYLYETETGVGAGAGTRTELVGARNLIFDLAAAERRTEQPDGSSSRIGDL